MSQKVQENSSRCLQMRSWKTKPKSILRNFLVLSELATLARCHLIQSQDDSSMVVDLTQSNLEVSYGSLTLNHDKKRSNFDWFSIS